MAKINMSIFLLYKDRYDRYVVGVFTSLDDAKNASISYIEKEQEYELFLSIEEWRIGAKNNYQDWQWDNNRRDWL